MSVSLKSYSKDAIRAVDEANERGILHFCIAIQGHARDLSPYQTGFLRSSITYKTMLSNGGGKVPLTVNPKKGIGFVGSNVSYALYQEFGTKNMSANAFLRPAGLIAKNPSQVYEIVELFDNQMDVHLKKV